MWYYIQTEGVRHALLIGERSDDGTEEHGGPEPGDEEPADVTLVEAVLAVQVVHVGPLQPVPSCNHLPQRNIVRNHQTHRHCTSIPDLDEAAPQGAGNSRLGRGEGEGDGGGIRGAYTS
jgi:hypothetical protein